MEEGAKECKNSLEAGKGRETNIPLDPSEGTSPVNTLTLAQ